MFETMKKNIALLINNLHEGGAQRVVSELSLLLCCDYNVSIIIIDGSDINYLYGGKIYSINCKHDDIGKDYTQYIKLIYQINKFKKNNNIDLTISFLPMSNLFNVISINRGKKIISITSHPSSYCNNIRDYLKFYIAGTLSNIIVSPTVGVKNDIVNNYIINSKKIFVSYNPFDIKNIKEMSRAIIDEKYENLFKYNVLISLGRLNPVKNHIMLIKAFIKGGKKFDNCKLLIIGSGPERERLEHEIRKANMSSSIILLGHKSNPFKYLNKSSIYIHSSNIEGFGNSLVEAMVCGLPVISTDCPVGPREILCQESNYEKPVKSVKRCEYGILVPPDNENELIIAIESLINDVALMDHYSQKSKKRAGDFDGEKLLSEWKKIIDRIL